MKRIIPFTLALVFLALSQSVGQERKANTDEKSDSARPLSATDKGSVIQAILDEMYVNNLQGSGFDAGKPISGSAYQLNAYFKPTLNSDQVGWVIYKLMPYGEVYRLFSIRSDGLAIVYGKLRDRFPPTQPSYLTVYMGDDQLCQMKKEWQKEQFVVELKPSADRIAEARARQQKRE
ncbi:MAG: hypothetical protein WCA00_00005 [Candidatus Acidiferrales bacterium]